MAYALLIVEPAGQRQARTEAEGRDLYDRMLRYGEDLKSRGCSRYRSLSRPIPRVLGCGCRGINRR